MLVNKSVVLGVGVVSSIVLARSLGPDGRGALAVALAFGTILVQFGSFGLQTANSYFTARGRASIGQLVTNSLWLAAGAGAVLIGVAVAVRLFAPSVVAGLGWTPLLLTSATVPALLAMIFLQAILLGEQRAVAYNLVEGGSALATLAALVAVESTVGLTLESSLCVVLGGYVAASTVFFGLLRGHHPPRSGPNLQLVRSMAAYASRIYVTGLIAYVTIRLDVLLVNGYLGSDEAGYYALAVALVDLLYVIPLVVAVNLFPRVSAGAGQSTSALAFRSVALPFAVACGLTAVVAPVIFETLYGQAFAPAATLFRWIAPGAFCYGILNILSYHFAAQGFPRRLIAYWLAGLVVNVSLNVILLPSEGTYIASLASSITYALMLVLHARLFASGGAGWRSLLPRPRELVSVLRHRPPPIR